MIGIAIAILLVLLKRLFDGLPSLKYEEKEHMFHWLPAMKKPMPYYVWKVKYKILNKKMHRKKVSFLKFYLIERAKIRWPHYRKAIHDTRVDSFKQVRAKIVGPIKTYGKGTWRFLTWDDNTNRIFRQWWAHKLPFTDWRIQELLRWTNISTLRYVLVNYGLTGANYYFETSQGNVTYDCLYQTWIGGTNGPGLTVEQCNDLSLSGDDVVAFHDDQSFQMADVGGADDHFTQGESGTSGHQIVFTNWGSGTNLPEVPAFNLDASYISFINLNVNNTTWTRAICNVNSASNSIIITDCEIESVDNAVIFSLGGNGFTMTGTSLTTTGPDTLLYFEGPVAQTWQNITVYNCSFDNPGKDCITIHDGGSNVANYATGPILIHTCTFTNCDSYSENILDLVSGKYGEIFGIELVYDGGGIAYGHSAGYADDGNGYWHIHHCLFQQESNTDSTININAPNLKLYNNLIIAGGRVQWTDEDHSRGTGVNGGYPVKGCEVYYNTIIDDGETTYGTLRVVYNTVDGFDTGSITFKNNIVTTTQASKAVVFSTTVNAGAWVANDGHLVFDYNCWYNPGGAITIYGNTFAQWQTDGQGAHSINSDSGLVDRTGVTGGWPDDAYLDTGSNCEGVGLAINAGNYKDNTGSATVGITVDYVSGSRDIATPDIGFMEYGAGPPATPPAVLEFQDCAFGDIVIDLS